MCDQQRLISARAYAQSDQSLCYSLEYSMSVKLLTKQHLVKERPHRLVCVYTCQNATLFKITCHGSNVFCGLVFDLSIHYFALARIDESKHIIGVFAARTCDKFKSTKLAQLRIIMTKIKLFK